MSVAIWKQQAPALSPDRREVSDDLLKDIRGRLYPPRGDEPSFGLFTDRIEITMPLVCVYEDGNAHVYQGKVSIEWPKGNWKPHQYVYWLHRQPVRFYQKGMLVAELARRAGPNGETWTFGNFKPTWAPRDMPPREDGKPNFVIRANYGLLTGVASSGVVTSTYDERLLQRRAPGVYNDVAIVDERIETAAEASGSMLTRSKGRLGKADLRWGPRKFLMTVLEAVAGVGGDCIVYLVHNDQELLIDADAFEAWLRQGQNNILEAMLTPLLEQK